MKKASKFEKVAARCWNLLNEGKPFTPIFVTGTMVLFYFTSLDDIPFLKAFFIGLLLTLPFIVLYNRFDFPLFLRNYLWIPLIAYLIIWKDVNLSLWTLAIGLYFFFTVFFWGTIYYHLRIGTSWLNFTRFWKLVLKNSDSTSGNAQEQLPKFLFILAVWDYFIHAQLNSMEVPIMNWVLFFLVLFVYTFILHHQLFDWKPAMIPSYVNDSHHTGEALNQKVIVMVIDGMRKERFADAQTPFLDYLRINGTEYTNMETVYPARTVVCFSSMFTGTYPIEHGITSNMVWKLGIKAESIFDTLRIVGKKGILLGIAHLVDSFGKNVETVTAVMKNDVADRNIIERAKLIMDEQDPDLFIIQLIGTDQTGHSRGVLYDEYVQKIQEADSLVEEYFNWLKDRGKLENYTFIVCADHGQADGIGGHGHLDEGERFVPFFMYGPKIEKGKKVEVKASLVSLASTIAYLLGAPIPSKARGPVLIDAIKKEKNN
ncbi:MAG TPA: alkaline phosphatase family protein [Pseudoneobacillus sp.]|nr:alkaline phosphatase family protein [Pseudoneobacillus sp.]